MQIGQIIKVPTERSIMETVKPAPAVQAPVQTPAKPAEQAPVKTQPKSAEQTPLKHNLQLRNHLSKPSKSLNKRPQLQQPHNSIRYRHMKRFTLLPNVLIPLLRLLPR
jgi:hypothetical protein